MVENLLLDWLLNNLESYRVYIEHGVGQTYNLLIHQLELLQLHTLV